jgi:hypothetical protein
MIARKEKFIKYYLNTYYKKDILYVVSAILNLLI